MNLFYARVSLTLFFLIINILLIFHWGRGAEMEREPRYSLRSDLRNCKNLHYLPFLFHPPLQAAWEGSPVSVTVHAGERDFPSTGLIKDMKDFVKWRAILAQQFL